MGQGLVVEAGNRPRGIGCREARNSWRGRSVDACQVAARLLASAKRVPPDGSVRREPPERAEPIHPTHASAQAAQQAPSHPIGHAPKKELLALCAEGCTVGSSTRSRHCRVDLWRYASEVFESKSSDKARAPPTSPLAAPKLAPPLLLSISTQGIVVVACQHQAFI